MCRMRASKVLNKLRDRQVVYCIKLNLADSRVTEIAAMAGFDCIWTDMEHVANDYSMVERQILAAKAHDVDVMVRVSRGGYSDYIKPLELDASGIMVPHIMSLQDAQAIVKQTRFAPIGRRPIDGGNADALFCAMSIQQYIQEANRERFVILQIEDPEPLNELDAIAELEGFDMLFFGPGDFSHAIGAPGDMANPLLKETQWRIAKAARAHGKAAGTVGSAGNITELVDLGYNFINLGADVIGLGEYFNRVLSQVNVNIGKGVY